MLCYVLCRLHRKSNLLEDQLTPEREQTRKLVIEMSQSSQSHTVLLTVVSAESPFLLSVAFLVFIVWITHVMEFLQISFTWRVNYMHKYMEDNVAHVVPAIEKSGSAIEKSGSDQVLSRKRPKWDEVHLSVCWLCTCLTLLAPPDPASE